jgi:hypothetical protein
MTQSIEGKTMTTSAACARRRRRRPNTGNITTRERPMKHTLTALALLTLLALLIPSDALGTKETVDLRFQFEEGETYALKMTMEQDVVMWINGNEQETHQTMVVTQVFDVKEVHFDGSATIEVTFDHMAMKAESPQGVFEYDSEDPPDEVPLQAKGFAAMVGETFTMRITPEGRVTEVSGIDELYDRMLEDLELPEEMKKMLGEQMKRQFGNEAIKGMVENFTAVLPPEPVAVGDSWSNEITLTAGFTAILEVTGTLTDRTDGVSTIELDCTIKPLPNAPPMDMGPMSITYKLEGTQKATLKIDEGACWFAEGRITQEMEGEIIMSGMPGPEGEQSVPILIESVITIESE